MRISGGRARGIVLKTPPGDKTRPATDYMREAVFSSLGPLVEEASVLDLFAGTGAYGLEALSRGAQSVDFVEKDKRAFACLKQNVEATQKSIGQADSNGNVRTTCMDVFQLEKTGTGHAHDLIFIDPPYALLEEKGERVLTLGLAHLNKEADAPARIILECPGRFELPQIQGLEIVKQIQKGKHQPSIFILKPS